MVIDQQVTEQFSLFNGDSAEVLASLPDESVHLSIYSPPFAVEGGGALFNYSSSDRDLSNARSYEEFFEHYGFIVEQIARVTLPGRISAVHCMDVPRRGANICGFTDFPGDIIRLHERHGFEYTPRICIYKEPLAVRNRTMSKALAHRQICEDSTRTNAACSDYLLPFRKRGENPIPVTHPVGLLEYAGEREMPAERLPYKGWVGDQKKNLFSHWIWRNYASAVWDDIRLNRVVPYVEGRDGADERHVHPLQRDVYDRGIVLWSNPGEVCLEPFAGVGSGPYSFVRAGRKAVGVELKPSYYRQMVRNVAEAVKGVDLNADPADADQLDLYADATDAAAAD